MIAELLSVVSERKPADFIEPNDVKVFQNAACTKDVPDAISALTPGDVVGRNVDRFCLCRVVTVFSTGAVAFVSTGLNASPAFDSIACRKDATTISESASPSEIKRYLLIYCFIKLIPRDLLLQCT